MYLTRYNILASKQRKNLLKLTKELRKIVQVCLLTMLELLDLFRSTART